VQKLLQKRSAAATTILERAKSTSTEIKCLLCGELAGDVVDGLSFRPRAGSAVRLVGRRMTCGRCGGSLAASERTQRYCY